MIQKRRRLLWLALLVVLTAVACGVGTTVVSELPGLAETLAVQTLSALQTAEYVSPTPTSPLAAALQQPATTPLPASQTPTITRTPTATITPIPPLTQRPTYTLTNTPTKTATRFIPTATRYSATNKNGKVKKGGVRIDPCTGEIIYSACRSGGVSANAPCLQAELVQDVTIPNGQIIAPGVSIRKIWRIRNSGTCAWPSDTHLVGATGNTWVGTGLNVGKNVNPGGTADFAVDLAPLGFTGDVIGGFVLNLSDVVLLGPKNGTAFTVSVRSQSVNSGVIWNFADDVCKAIWENNNCQRITCNSSTGGKSGFAVKAAPGTLEDGVAYSPVLWTQPFVQKNGNITGTFPAFWTRGDEKLRVSVGCMYGYTSCKVRFEIYLSFLNQSPIKIGTVDKSHNGSTAPLVSSYSLPAGYVGVIFRLINLGEGSHAMGGWFNVDLYR